MQDEPTAAPIATDKVSWTKWSEFPRFGLRYRHLSPLAVGKDYRVGVAIEELAPGKQSTPAHYHLFEEEHVFVLEGEMIVRIGDKRHPMKAGDYVWFPAGQMAGHCLINAGDAICRYVMIGEHKPNEVVFYTDSGKVLVRSPGQRLMLDMSATRGYFDGEDTGLAVGETPPPETVAPAVEPKEPARPVSSESVQWDTEGDGPRFGGQSRHLTFAAVGRAYHVGVLIEAPAPGMRLAPKHYHMLEEEHALILEGEVTLLLGDEQYPMRAGDYVAFPAGRKVGHSFLNSGSGPCRYLMIGERNPADVCVYTDSNKLSVRALKTEADIFDMSATRTYWDGEQTE